MKPSQTQILIVMNLCEFYEFFYILKEFGTFLDFVCYLLFMVFLVRFCVKKFMKLSENICDALRNLLPFVQFKKREKHPWRSVTFSKVAG